MKIKKGDYVYYHKKVDNTSETVPAIVLKVNLKTLRINGNFNEGDKIVNVKKENCELQTEWLEGR